MVPEKKKFPNVSTDCKVANCGPRVGLHSTPQTTSFIILMTSLVEFK